MQQKIIPNLWFDTEAEDAAGFYTSVFKNSRVVNVTHYTEAGPREAGGVMTVEFELRKLDIDALRSAADGVPVS